MAGEGLNFIRPRGVESDVNPLQVRQRNVDGLLIPDTQDERVYGTSKYRPPVRSNIQSQLSHITQMYGYSRPTRFHIEIEQIDSATNERLARNCMSTTLPGRGLQSQPLRIYGPPDEFVYETNYQNEIQITFRVGADMFERVFFEDWIKAAYSNQSADVQYYDVYRRGINIFQLDTIDRKVLCLRLDGAFCKSIGDIELSTDASDQIETLTVTIGYREYQIVGKTIQEDREKAWLEFAQQDQLNKSIDDLVEAFKTEEVSTFLQQKNKNISLHRNPPTITLFK